MRQAELFRYLRENQESHHQEGVEVVTFCARVPTGLVFVVGMEWLLSPERAVGSQYEVGDS